MAKKKYDESSITVLEGLDAVRKKPTMYMGMAGEPMVMKMLAEVAENCIDEYANNNNDYLGVFCENKKNPQTFVVVDKGRGIPVGKHKKTGMSTLTTIMTKLHAGGKFEEAGKGGYADSQGIRGTHGVGVSCTNALSTKFEVWTCRESVWYHQSFSEGKPTSEVKKAKFPKEYKDIADSKKGTIVKFTPDYSITTKVTLTEDTLKKWLKDLSILNTGLKIKFKDSSGKVTDYFNKLGPQGYLKELVAKLGCTTLGKPFIFESKNLVLAFQWSDYDSEDGLKSYVNGAATENGGTHIKGAYDAITKAFKKFSSSRDKFRAQDIRYGIIGFINYKLHNAEYKSQTKEELVTIKATNDVSTQMEKPLVSFLKTNKSTVKAIIKRANDIKKANDEAKKLRQAAGSLKSSVKRTASLKGMVKCDPAKRELYIFEGGSAGGTAFDARDETFQEILELKGKPLNAEKTALAKIFASEVIQKIFTYIGISDPKELLGTKKKKVLSLRVGKIIVLADPDPDGQHINSLVHTVLYKFIPEAYEQGIVYTVDAPLYFANNNKGHKFFGYTLKEIVSKVGDKVPITRAKGWGEINFEMLQEIAFEPKTRKLFRVMPISSKEHTYFKKVVGEDSSTRKKILGLV